MIHIYHVIQNDKTHMSKYRMPNKIQNDRYFEATKMGEILDNGVKVMYFQTFFSFDYCYYNVITVLIPEYDVYTVQEASWPP